MIKNALTLAGLLTAVSSGLVFASAGFEAEPMIDPEYAVKPMTLPAVAPVSSDGAIERLGMNFGMEEEPAPAPAAAATQSAAKADFQAMVNPEQPVAPKADEIANMGGDQAGAAGEEMMDRILYIKGASQGQASVPSQASGQQEQEPGPGRLAKFISAPRRAQSAAIDFIARKTGKTPERVSTVIGAGFLFSSIVPVMMSVILHHSLPGGAWPWLGAFWIGLDMLDRRTPAQDKADETETNARLADAADQVRSQLQGVAGVAGVTTEISDEPEENDDDYDENHFVVVRMKEISASNIGKIPDEIDGFRVKVQLVRQG